MSKLDKEETEILKKFSDFCDLCALPNMGDEGRKAKLIAFFEWKIQFEPYLQRYIKTTKNNKAQYERFYQKTSQLSIEKIVLQERIEAYRKWLIESANIDQDILIGTCAEKFEEIFGNQSSSGKETREQ